jgi:hypothetical protein
LLVASSVAVIVTGDGVVTFSVSTVNVADVAPDETVTDAGTVATPGSALSSETVVPPAGAGPVSVTVPVEDERATTVRGFSVRLRRSAGRTVNSAVFVVPPSRAEIVTGVEVPTPKAVTVNVAEVEPAATVTDAGTVAADVSELVSETLEPPEGAGPLSVTVPVEVAPLVTVVGLSVTDDGTGGTTVNVACRVAP